MISSGSALSANAVNPRKSPNRTAISLRWLSSTLSSPEEMMSSATCGARKRFRRPTRSISASCSATRACRLRFQIGQLGRLRLNLIVERLNAQHGSHPRDERRLVDRLGQIVVGASIEPGNQIFAIRLGRHQNDRHERQGAVSPSSGGRLDSV